MRVATHDGAGSDYATSDPVLSRHGMLYKMPFIRRDMLMLENQLPLLVLERLVAVMTAQPPVANTITTRYVRQPFYPILSLNCILINVELVKKKKHSNLISTDAGYATQSHEEINMMVLRFSRLPPAPAGGFELGLHPLAVYRGSLVHGVYRVSRDLPEDTDQTAIIRPAVELHEAGVRFRKSWTSSLRDIRFRRGVLSVPALSVDDSTECAFLNMMAFEKLHAGAGSDVAAYVFFMSNVLDSARDVALLCSEGIIQNAADSDKAVAQMFERMSKDAVLEPESAIDAVHRQVNAYCRRRPWRMCGTGTSRSRWDERLRTSTWAILAVVLLVMLIVQTMHLHRAAVLYIY